MSDLEILLAIIQNCQQYDQLNMIWKLVIADESHYCFSMETINGPIFEALLKRRSELRPK